MFKYLNIKKEKGLTLIEILVTLGIITLFASIILINYRNSGGDFALQRSAHKLAQDIRRAQGMAMSAKEFGEPPEAPKSGYGIYLESVGQNFYRLYAAIEDREEYCGREADCLVEKIGLENGVYIKDILPSQNLSINFKPPRPKVRINEFSKATIILSLEAEPTKERKVEVNIIGLIDVE